MNRLRQIEEIVEKAMAENCRPFPILKSIGDDFFFAENTAREVLLRYMFVFSWRYFSLDDKSRVYSALCKNHHCPPDILSQMYERGHNLSELTSHPNFPLDALLSAGSTSDEFTGEDTPKQSIESIISYFLIR